MEFAFLDPPDPVSQLILAPHRLYGSETLVRTVWLPFCVPVLRGRGGVAASEPSGHVANGHVANGHVASGPRQETQQQKLRYARSSFTQRSSP